MNVVVTGASTGIGRATSILLADRGDRVFAGVRKPADLEALAALGKPGLVPVLLDVADEASIRSAMAGVAETLGTEALHGLVNNAGIGHGGPIEFVPMAEWREQFEVNLFGQIGMIQASADLLRRGPGRIVNITSIGGLVSQPFLAPYCASKFALEALSDSLRGELAPWGIQVTAVEPGTIATPIWDKSQDTARRNRERLGDLAMERYGAVLDAVAERLERSGKAGIPPERVAEVIVRVLTASRAPTRVKVGTDARIGSLLKWALPDRWFDSVIAGR